MPGLVFFLVLAYLQEENKAKQRKSSDVFSPLSPNSRYNHEQEKHVSLYKEPTCLSYG